MTNEKKNNVFILVGIAIITVMGILSLMPLENDTLLSKLASDDLPLADVGGRNSEDGWRIHDSNVPVEEVSEFVVNDEVLDSFIRVYTMDISGKTSIKQLSPYDKEDVRLILENMGSYNTTRLKEVLKKTERSEVAQGVEMVLDENLFYWDMHRLDVILGIEAE